jgi:3-hydroxybutyrate dehydrogenase
MNIAVNSENLPTTKALAGRVSLVTGSTSGIGLGIACALAAAGSEIVLNGFGEPESIAEVQ